MDLSFTQEEIAFRDEARRFFREEFPAEIREKVAAGHHLTKDETIRAQRALNARGWAVPNWPVEWGGQSWSPVQVYIYQDEMQQANVPAPLAFNTSMVGPVIAQFGSDEQKQRFLARAANLDDWWCQGFSEPGSGSDLASLRTKAERHGDTWVINGQKTWTTLAQTRRLDFLSVPHRSVGEEAAGHLLHRVPDDFEGHHGAPDPDHRRRARGQRGVLR